VGRGRSQHDHQNQKNKHSHWTCPPCYPFLFTNK
jgi:hypothetical protein